MSPVMRVALALGILLAGLFLAWPYYRTPPPDVTNGVRLADQSLSLGEGVSLQMPGQTPGTPLPAQPPAPWLTESESAVGAPDAPAEPARNIPSSPPALPDRYRPLFKPGATAGAGPGWALPTGHPLTMPAKPLRQHTIRDGDTLESLSARYLGDAQRAEEILEANREMLADPQLLPIGTTIVIPRGGRGAPGQGASPNGDESPALVPLPLGGLRRGR